MHKSLLACARGYFYEFQSALAVYFYLGERTYADGFTHAKSKTSAHIHSCNFEDTRVRGFRIRSRLTAMQDPTEAKGNVTGRS